MELDALPGGRRRFCATPGPCRMQRARDGACENPDRDEARMKQQSTRSRSALPTRDVRALA